MTESIIDTLIKKSVHFHYVLHGFWVGRGKGTSIMDLKLEQELASFYQEPLLLLLLDLRKAYDNFDRGQLLKTLEGYGAGPKMWGMLAEFWARQEVFTIQNGYHGPQFSVTRGTKKGGLKFPTLFNVEVENVVRHWLFMTVEDDAVIHDGLVHAVGRSIGVLYADNGLIGSQEPKLLQGPLKYSLACSTRLA